MNTKQLEILQLRENKEMCEILKASGDKSDVAHTLVHKLEFISEYKKSDLLEELEERGFVITESFVTEEGYNGLLFENQSTTELDSIQALTLWLIALLDEHDARYGGWITEVVG